MGINKIVTLVCAGTSLLAAQETPWKNITPIASVQLQGEKFLYKTAKDDNFDRLWGRVNLGLQYSSEDYFARLYFRGYPSNFGYEPLAGATVTGDTIATQSMKIDKIQIPEGYVRFNGTGVNVQVGRYAVLLNPRATFFGYYIDTGMDLLGAFEGRGAVYNALQLTKTVNLNESGAKAGSQVDFIVNDDKINKGDLRVSQSFDGLIQNHLGMSLTYRGNLFDRILDGEAVLKHNVDAQVYVAVVKPVTIFVETAGKGFGKDAKGNRVEGDVPVLFGVNASFPKVINTAVVEFQYLEKENQDPFLWNLTVCKTVGPHLNFDVGLYSMVKTDQPAIGIRMNSKM